MKLLKETPHTRRAQAVTWQAWNDLGIDDPACLQRMWFRIEEPEGGGRPQLNLAIHIRSNDAFKAAFMNMFAFTELQREMAARAGRRAGRVHAHRRQFPHLRLVLRGVRGVPEA